MNFRRFTFKLIETSHSNLSGLDVFRVFPNKKMPQRETETATEDPKIEPMSP